MRNCDCSRQIVAIERSQTGNWRQTTGALHFTDCNKGWQRSQAGHKHVRQWKTNKNGQINFQLSDFLTLPELFFPTLPLPWWFCQRKQRIGNIFRITKGKRKNKKKNGDGDRKIIKMALAVLKGNK